MTPSIKQKKKGRTAPINLTTLIRAAKAQALTEMQQWDCPVCQSINMVGRYHCQKCGTPRPPDIRFVYHREVG